MEKTWDDFPSGALLERESGDGDSGAECKELSASPLAVRKDFLDITDALTTITREVQGEERPRETKKCSRIPVRQVRTTNIKTEVLKFDTVDDSEYLETLEKWREIQQFVEDEEYARLEDFMENESLLEEILKDPDMNCSKENDLNDIFTDLTILPSTSSDTSVEGSLSPVAPVASQEPSQSDKSEESSSSPVDLPQDEQILEAPEEFRCSVPQEETSLSTTATVERDRDKDPEPEVFNDKDTLTMGTAGATESTDITIRGSQIATTMAYTNSGRLETVYECDGSLPNSVERGRRHDFVTESDRQTISLQQFNSDEKTCDEPDYRTGIDGFTCVLSDLSNRIKNREAISDLIDNETNTVSASSTRINICDREATGATSIEFASINNSSSEIIGSSETLDNKTDLEVSGSETSDPSIGVIDTINHEAKQVDLDKYSYALSTISKLKFQELKKIQISRPTDTFSKGLVHGGSYKSPGLSKLTNPASDPNDLSVLATIETLNPTRNLCPDRREPTSTYPGIVFKGLSNAQPLNPTRNPFEEESILRVDSSCVKSPTAIDISSDISTRLVAESSYSGLFYKGVSKNPAKSLFEAETTLQPDPSSVKTTNVKVQECITSPAEFDELNVSVNGPTTGSVSKLSDNKLSSCRKDETHMQRETMTTISCVRDSDNGCSPSPASACVVARTLGRAAIAAAASALVQESIANGDALRTARGSRTQTAKVHATAQHCCLAGGDTSRSVGVAECCCPPASSDAPRHLNWDFRNGRLVFIAAGRDENEDKHTNLVTKQLNYKNTSPNKQTESTKNINICNSANEKCCSFKTNNVKQPINIKCSECSAPSNDDYCDNFSGRNSFKSKCTCDHLDAPEQCSDFIIHNTNKCTPNKPTVSDCLDNYAELRIETQLLKDDSSLVANEPNPVKSDYLEILRSRDINKRPVQGRLKLLETKLKEAAGLSSYKHAEDTRTSDSWNVQEHEFVKGQLLGPDSEKVSSQSIGNAQNDATLEKPEEIVKNAQTQEAGVVQSLEGQPSSEEQVVDQSLRVRQLDRNDNECKVSEVASSSRGHRREEDASDEDSDYYPQIEITELGSPADLDAFLDDRFGGRCEFDVKRIGAFTGFGGDSEFYLVYDELEQEPEGTEDADEPDDTNDSDSSSDGNTLIDASEKAKMRGDSGTLEGGAKRHNPDHNNLKSLLKKPGRSHHKKNRVSFNENKNEFFDADYIILIREECDYDEDDEDGVCTCNQHEMVRLTCCEPNCNCNYEDGVSGAPSAPGGQTGSGGRGYDGPTPQSPKFAPPLEFVDSVTLSPPEGYKDMDLGEQQLIALQQIARHRQQQALQQQQTQQQAVCRECSGVHDSDSNSGSEGEEYIDKSHEELRQRRSDISGDAYQATPAELQHQEDKEKTDQSQQTTPTTPPADGCAPVQSRYIMETITMTTVTERRLVREVEDAVKGTASPTDSSPCPSIQGGGSPISGILKGGKLWKQSFAEGQPPGAGLTINNQRSDNNQMSDASNSITSDEEGNTVSRRSVRFSECDATDTRDSCDGEADQTIHDEVDEKTVEDIEDNLQKDTDICNNVSPDATEMMLTFKLGNHVLISNNSLRPNSAVRQLFPCGKPGQKDEEGAVHQYLVTAESLRAFEDAKRSKLPQIIQGDNDDTIRRTIERNTLRRSLIRYEPRSKKQMQKTDNSLVERIKLLTCDVDEPPLEEDIPPRGSPSGEESTKPEAPNNRNDKSFSPSSSASSTSSNSSMSSTYKKITDLFGKKEKQSDAQNNAINDKQSLLQPAPDLGNGGTEFIEPQNAVAKVNTTSEARKQFLSTLAPLSACVGGTIPPDEYQYQYQLANNAAGERASVASTVGTEYSLEDIDEALKNDEKSKKVAPDVLVGTPSASESTDELAIFVQQDAGRIERIKKRYQSETVTEEDDEHDDYGFNRRPSVRGIKPRFGSTNEILQQIQSQLQPPTGSPQGQPSQTQAPQPAPRAQANHVWPYYSETTGLKSTCPTQYYPYEELKARTLAHQYRPTSLIEESLYQNCPNQRCTQVHYPPMNVAPVMRIGGGGCADFYQTLPARTRTTRPESPPPMEISRSYHQTMVLIPYNRIENFQTAGPVSPNPLYSTAEQCNYAKFKKIPPNTKRYPEPLYHGTLPRQGHHLDPDYQLKMGQKMIRVPYSSGQPVQVHLMASRSESPVPGQFATARATQTCSYYNPGPPNTRYRPAIGPGVMANGTVWAENPYGTTKINRHSFPAGGARFMSDNISLADSEHSVQLPNGYRQSIETQYSARESAPTSPTKSSRFSERGVPEGAASVSPQDSMTAHTTTSTMTSPTSPQNPSAQASPGAQGTTSKSLYYAMNV